MDRGPRESGHWTARHIPGRRRRSGAPRTLHLRARTPAVRIFAASCRRRQEAPLASTTGQRLRPAAYRGSRPSPGGQRERRQPPHSVMPTKVGIHDRPRAQCLFSSPHPQAPNPGKWALDRAPPPRTPKAIRGPARSFSAGEDARGPHFRSVMPTKARSAPCINDRPTLAPCGLPWIPAFAGRTAREAPNWTAGHIP